MNKKEIKEFATIMRKIIHLSYQLGFTDPCEQNAELHDKIYFMIQDVMKVACESIEIIDDEIKVLDEWDRSSTHSDFDFHDDAIIFDIPDILKKLYRGI